LYDRLADPVLSSGMGNVRLLSEAKADASDNESWLVALTAAMINPRSSYSANTCWKAGISALQGGHQLAQKFIITGDPRNSEREKFSPERVVKLKSGAKKLSCGATIGCKDPESVGILETQTQAKPARRINIDTNC